MILPCEITVPSAWKSRFVPLKFPVKFTVPVPVIFVFVAKTLLLKVEFEPFAPAFTLFKLFVMFPTVPFTVPLPKSVKFPVLSLLVIVELIVFPSEIFSVELFVISVFVALIFPLTIVLFSFVIFKSFKFEISPVTVWFWEPFIFIVPLFPLSVVIFPVKLSSKFTVPSFLKVNLSLKLTSFLKVAISVVSISILPAVTLSWNSTFPWIFIFPSLPRLVVPATVLFPLIIIFAV